MGRGRGSWEKPPASWGAGAGTHGRASRYTSSLVCGSENNNGIVYTELVCFVYSEEDPIVIGGVLRAIEWDSLFFVYLKAFVFPQTEKKAHTQPQ